MRKFLVIIFREFKTIFSDRSAILIMFIAVLLYAFGYVLPYDKEIIKEIPIGVIDLDDSTFSRRFIKDLHVTDTINIVGDCHSIAEAENELYKGKLKGFVVIPKDFERDTYRGKQVDVSLYADSAYLIIYKTLYASVIQTAIEDGAKIEIGRMMKSGIPKKQAMAIKQPFEFVQVPLFNSIGGYKSYVYPVILAMIIHQTLILGIGLLQGTRNEKKEKYCKKPKEIPFTLFTRTTACILPYLLYGLVGFFIFPSVFTFPSYYNVLPLLTMYVLMLYTTGFFAQTVSYFFRIRETALLLLVPTSIIFIFLTGLIWPRETIPPILNLISFFIPATCSIDGLIKLNQNGAGFFNIIYDYLWLGFLCILYFFTAVYLTEKSDREF